MGGKGFGSGGVGGSNVQKEEKWRCGVGGGEPTGAGLVDGGVDQGPWLQERVGGGVGTMAVPKERGGLGLGWLLQVQGRGQGRVGLAVGVQGLRLRGVRW